MTRAGKSLLALVAVLVVIGLAIGTQISMRQTVPMGGAFSLTDSSGATVSEQDFAGKWTLLYFGYSFCPDVCPTSLMILGLAMDGLPPHVAENLTPIFISVDPERDIPATADEYAKSFHPQFIGLSGTPEQIAAVTKTYQVHAQKVTTEDDDFYTIDHTSLFFLLNTEGEFVKLLPAHDNTPKELTQSLLEAIQ